MQHLSSRLLILLLFFGTFFSAFGQKEPVNISDLTKIVTTGSISISPDGEKAIFVKSFMEEEQGSFTYKRQLWMMDMKQPNTMRPISSPTANSSGASFSPDGKTLAFTRAYKGKSQIWLLPLNGGEAQVLTDAKYGASNPVWSPDGKKILFSSTLPMWAIEGEPDWEHQRPGRSFGDEPDYRAIQAGLAKEEVKPNVDGDLAELRAWLAKNAAKQDPKVIDRLNFLGEKDLSPDLYFSHLYTIDLESKTETTLTSGFQNYFGATWSPDGSYILASSLKNELHPDFTQHTEVWKVDLATQEASVFFALEGFRVGNPNFSPDGKSILVSGQEIDEPSYNQSMIGVLQANGSGFKWLTESLDRSVGSAKWSTDSKSIYFTAANEGGFSLWSVQASNAKITPLITGQVGVGSFDLHGDRLLYAFTEVKNPSELYLADKNAKNARQITRFNEDWLATKEISFPKAHRLKTDDGFEIEYWVMEPVGRKPGVKYPTVLQMHGGPSAMWGPVKALCGMNSKSWLRRATVSCMATQEALADMEKPSKRGTSKTGEMALHPMC
ncbi:S9 family peptidase [Nitritalea halalkaliphila]|uniref:S9 family peptidase n=1 Tax=Nitritalea halalkaliphila TaxID=590849 RepID=UPI0002D7F225|nr:hypothetical protein [Nitritalea halalkaliphila]